MAKISLTSYLIKVKDKNTGNYFKFNEIKDDNGNEYSFYEIMNEYFSSRKNSYSDNENDKKILNVYKNNYKKEKDGNLVKYHLLKGIIQTGSYGYSSEIYNTETGEIEFRKPPTSAEMLPFFYGLYLPNEEKGICIFQRFKQFGIKYTFESNLKDFVNKNYSFLSIEINPLLPDDYLRNFFDKGNIKKLRFVKYEVASDITDRIGGRGADSKVGEVEYVIKAKRRKNLPVNSKFSNLLNNKGDIKEMFEISNFKYDNIKVELKLNGVIKTINMENIENLNGSYDVTDDVEYGKNGHPTYISIGKTSKNYAESFLINLGLLYERGD